MLRSLQFDIARGGSISNIVTKSISNEITRTFIVVEKMTTETP